MRLTIFRSITVIASFSLALASASADDQALPGNDALRHVRALSAPQLSPDGKQVLFQLKESTADGGASHLWLVDLAGHAARQLTWSPPTDKLGEQAGAWRASGTEILFLAKRGDHKQLFRLPMAGGEAHPYDLKIIPPVDESLDSDRIPPRKADDPPVKQDQVVLDIDSFAASPDGHTIALLARDPQTPGEKKQQDDKADALWRDHDRHGVRLYLLDGDSGALTASAVPSDLQKIVWNRTGDRLIALTEAPNHAADLGPANAGWLVERADPAHPKRLDTLPPTVNGGAWSWDGRAFYFVAQAKQDAPPGYHDLYCLTLADGSIRVLSDGFTGSIDNQPPIATEKGVLQAVQLGTRQGVMLFNEGKPTEVAFDHPIITQLASNAGQTGWVWLASSATEPDRLYYADRLGQKPRRLDTPDPLPGPWPMVPSQRVHWHNEGLDIEGLLYLPPATPGHKAPLIVAVHGGPTGVWHDGFDPLTLFLVGHGWAVLKPNPRGSTGYGAAFAAANRNDLGGADFRDIMTGLDSVLATHPLDPDRLALFGYSYGGEMAGFAEGLTHRFKAIVSGAPVIDQHSEYGTEDQSWYDRWFYGKPWDHPEDAWRQSPLAHVANAVTPFLLLQGDSDKTDPLGQSLEMYRALRQVGVQVELVQYPREDHGPLSASMRGSPTGEPWHGFDARQRIEAFVTAAFGMAK